MIQLEVLYNFCVLVSKSIAISVCKAISHLSSFCTPWCLTARAHLQADWIATSQLSSTHKELCSCCNVGIKVLLACCSMSSVTSFSFLHSQTFDGVDWHSRRWYDRNYLDYVSLSGSRPVYRLSRCTLHTSLPFICITQNRVLDIFKCHLSPSPILLKALIYICPMIFKNWYQSCPHCKVKLGK